LIILEGCFDLSKSDWGRTKGGEVLKLAGANKERDCFGALDGYQRDDGYECRIVILYEFLLAVELGGHVSICLSGYIILFSPTRVIQTGTKSI
jgi:hypothetical protein